MARDAAEAEPGEKRTQGTDAGLHRDQRLQTWFLGIIALAIVLVLLVEARFLMISLVVAIILFSLTADAIHAIARLRLGPLHIPRWLASLVAVALISSGLLTLSAIIVAEVNTVLSTALAYTAQAEAGLTELFGWMGAGAQAAVVAAIRTIDFGGSLRTAAGQAGNVLSATVLVILFVGFLFVERLWFATKLVSLTGDAGRAARIEAIIGAIMRRVNRYLLVKTLVSLLTGSLVFAVMRGFGLQFAEASGILTFVLNFLPNLGSIVATILVALIALVQATEPAVAIAVFLSVTAIQFAIGNVLDPILMGRALRLSSFGILLSLAFWGAVWGVPGMFLAVPIMVAVMIVCSHVPALRPVAVILSREGLPEGAAEPAAAAGPGREAG